MANGNGAIPPPPAGYTLTGGSTPPPPAGYTLTGGSTAAQQQPEGTPGMLGYVKGIGQGLLNTIGGMGQGGGPAYMTGGGTAPLVGGIVPTPKTYTPPPEFQPQSTAEKAGYYTEKGAELAAPIVGAGVKAAQAAGAAEKAGALFESLSSEIGDHPVDPSQAGNIALKAQEWAARGGQKVKQITDFVKRVTDPSLGDLTYNEARDFYSNASSRLSAEQAMKLTPTAKRYLSQFASALDSAIEDTASAAGRLDDYRTAMSQYATGKGFETAVGAGVDYLKQQALKWAVPGSVYAIARKLSP